MWLSFLAITFQEPAGRGLCHQLSSGHGLPELLRERQRPSERPGMATAMAPPDVDVGQLPEKWRGLWEMVGKLEYP